MTKFTINKQDPYIDLTYGDFKLTNKLAAFDLDDTLVRPKSGAKFPKDENDWALLNKKVKSKLEELHKSGYCIVIISNQKGLSSGKHSTPDVWIKKIKLIGEHLQLPLRCFASIDSDIYRKPNPTFYLNLAKEGNITFAKESFYCGDAAGRKNDFSDTDRKFALNTGLEFKLPEQLFLNEQVTLPLVEYNVDFSKLNKKSNFNFAPNNKEMLLMIGYPGSGKSTFVQDYLKNYVRVNMDTLKTKAKCIKECEKALKDNKSVVIDNTNPDKDTRKNYIDLAKKYKYTVRCIKIDCPMEVAIHNSYYRAFITDGKTNHVPMVVYHKYKKSYEEPDKSEGIKEIITVPYSTPDDKRYRYYYY
jgi:bifunctional polynucleotide phosphatase/kinase